LSSIGSIALFAMLSGCAISAGPTISHPTEGGVALGDEVEGLLYVTRGRGYLSRGAGPVVGVRLAAERRTPSADPYFGRAALLLGYSTSPLPYRRRVGIEPLLGIGVGAYPVGATSSRSIAVDGRVAFPIRLTADRSLWDSDYVAGATPMIVPYLSAGYYFPYADTVDKTTRGEIGAGLLFRVHIWSSLTP
jgi:hypothetical protein